MDYQFLVGEHFAVKGEVFTVDSIRTMDDQVFADATLASTRDTTTSRSFQASEVMEALITEEIELFQTGGIVTA